MGSFATAPANGAALCTPSLLAVEKSTESAAVRRLNLTDPIINTAGTRVRKRKNRYINEREQLGTVVARENHFCGLWGP